ncbi:MAG: Xaa-Pro aminopeptidase, partial [Candidatus Marinamargulisbacteria bacterium]
GSYFLNSFPSIVAAGKNATILHYMKNNAPFKSGDMILLDFGARWQNMCADVSRTVPVNGRFSPLQKLLYGIVLEAQKAVESAAKPGTTIAHLNQVCWDYINQELQEKIIAKGGKVRLDYKVRPHNVSHLMGVQVHEGDPFRHYRNHKLKADWMISNEPGLYGHFSLTIDGELHEQTIGIRIEDNLIITKDGCRNLSLGCPKEIKALEQLIQPSTRT